MALWGDRFGEDVFHTARRKGMGAEDFPFFTTDPYIPSTYFAVGGTPQADFDREAAGGPPVPSHHSPLFKITPRPAVTPGVPADAAPTRGEACGAGGARRLARRGGLLDGRTDLVLGQLRLARVGAHQSGFAVRDRRAAGDRSCTAAASPRPARAPRRGRGTRGRWDP